MSLWIFQLTFLAFNDVAAHDILWGELTVEWGDRFDLGYTQHLLSLGLESIYMVMSADTYEARHKLLYCDYPQSNDKFLYEGLKAANIIDVSPDLRDFTNVDELIYMRPPFFHEFDPGPAEIWRWAHQEDTCLSFINAGCQKSLREWGYVMWDFKRLYKLGIFKTTFKKVYVFGRTEEELDHEVKMLSSFYERSLLFRLGARGWWSRGDYTKITWRQEKHFQRFRSKAKNLYEPKSLEQAKSFLASLSIPPAKAGSSQTKE